MKNVVKTDRALDMQGGWQERNDNHMAVRAEIARLRAYVPGESLEAFSQRTAVPVERIIKLNANESPYGPVPAALQALREHDWYNWYPDTRAAQLKDAIAAYTGVDVEQIVVGHGSMEIIALLWQLLLAPGDAFLSCPPTFSLYATTAALCGAEMRNIERGANYEIDVEHILDALTPDIKMIVLCSPNNPTGNPLAEEALLRLLETGRLIIVDEAYVEFSTRPRGFASLVEQYDNLIVLRTFSKWAGLAGLRVGYGLLPRWIVPYVQRTQQPFEVNVAGSLAAIATLTHLEEARERVQFIVEERRRIFYLLAGQPYLYPLPSEGNFILARVAEGMQMQQIQREMERQGILLRYFPQLDKRNDYVRVTVGRREHTQRLAEAFELVGEQMAQKK